MKSKFILLSFLLFCPIMLLTSRAQENRTSYATIWVKHKDNTSERMLLYEKPKESLHVGDVVYSKLVIDGFGEYYYRMDGKKLMRYDADKGEEYVLYDFGLYENWYFGTPDDRVMHVVEKGDTVFGEGMPAFHYLKLENDDFKYDTDVWIENYGSLYTSILQPSELGDDVVESRLLFDRVEPLANIFYSERIQTQMMKIEKVTDYYNIIDETVPEIEIIPDSLHCEFIGDTLVISGRLQRHGTDLHYLSCELVDNTVLFRVDDLSDLTITPKMYYFTAKFPGFKQGTYTVNYDDKILRSEAINIEVTKPYDLNEKFQESAFRLFSEVTNKTDYDNLCFSPLSLQVALCMANNGANGNTLKQMKESLGLESFSDEEVNSYSQQLINKLTTRPEFVLEEWTWWGQNISEEYARKKYDATYPVCELAEAVWTKPDITLRSEFKDILQNYYDAEADAVDFTTQEGIDVVNNWVSNKTHGLIPKIYNQPQNEYLWVVLTNALYFKGSWLNQFDVLETRADTFLIDDSNAVKTDMMFAKSTFKTAETNTFRIIKLFYGNEKYSMTLFVPKNGTSLPELTFDDWYMSNSEEMKYKSIKLSMPKFHINGDYNLVSLLKKMGMTDAFESNLADFSRMGDFPGYISSVKQMSNISVDEEGTEAAAVTVLDFGGWGGDPYDMYEEFKVDRPFYFTIENNYTSTVLFAGRVKSLNGAHITVPTTGINTPDMDDENAPVYDLSGRRLNQVPERGLYIQNGKKYYRY